MKKIVTTAAVAAALITATVSPAAAQNREHQQQAAELRMLQEQQVQLALSIAQLTQALTEAVKAINSRIDQTNQMIEKKFADQSLGIKSMGDDLRTIRERSQDTSTRLGELKDEIEALRRDLTLLMTRAPVAVPADPLDPNAPPAPVPPLISTGPTPASTLGQSPERMFNTANADYASGQFDLAIEGFDGLLRTFPTSEKADDAQQGIGDAEYARNRFDDAIAAYNRVIQNYPRSEHLPWAYYKRGLAQGRAGRNDEARASFEEAIKRYPESEAAQLAKQGLDRIGRATPAAARP
jgi:tol-pal system protein YbgF